MQKKYVNSTLYILIMALLSVSSVWADEVIQFKTKGEPAYFVNDVQNPEITLKRGMTYQFEMNAPGHPLWIKTNISAGKNDAYTNGIAGNGTDRGKITFVVPADAPAVLFYNCQFHVVMNGKINITD